MGILKKLLDSEYKELKRFDKLADEIISLEDSMANLKDEDFKNKTNEFKERLSKGETLDDILVQAFALAREACYRGIGEKPFKVQIIGGLAIHYGNIAEMKTGEGKTLTTVLPAYVNSLTGKGVHVVTTNEYLSDRNANWMKPIYDLLGVSVGVNLRDMTPKEKQDVYNCDITYSTNNEIGFDYLRDNMVVNKEDRVQRPLNYCIIDEVDSILIDEARTPLIISGGKANSNSLYIEANRAVKNLKEDEDYTVDLKTKSVSLTEEGSKKIEKILNIKNLYDIDNAVLVHHLNQALKANYAFAKDVDYVVSDGQVIIVDQFTGRLMQGRQYSDGLHQAIEAKEGVTINVETKTMATITFQNLFRMYNKLSGMTGTAKTEEEEFRNIYNMYVICIPTNKPVIREDLADLVYATEKGKYKAIINTVKEIHSKGQPILIGTISVESNEHLSGLLKKAGLPHEVLNAKNHEREAEIIAKAGEKGAITLATNMAGRGTDIKLGEGVKELGGLCVIGTERHESRRIDNQLRGRAGRQGDPGMSQFFVSFEDDLMRRFGTDRIKMMLQSLGVDDDMAIRSKTLTKSIETAQKRVEGNNYDIRKSLLDYDNVLNEQREIIYNKRNEIIDNESISQTVMDTFKETINVLCENHIAPEGHLTENDKSEIVEYVNTNFLKKQNLKVEDIIDLKDKDVPEYISSLVIKDYEEKVKGLPVRNEFERAISLRVIDSNWVEHMNTMEHLKEGIGLRGYSQTNPVQAYTMEGFELFDKLLDKIDNDISVFLLKAEIRQNTEMKQTIKGSANDGKEKIKSTPKKVTKIGRNDPCPCGSGKKYKQCCGK
ncbi:MAG: preprotein translocase subunit SecA [Mycoplasma sp.]|nr:preprotein translocase subunit SecA [Mycoplasma sp.]MDY4619298.1 preprotein translocase subunit SecA [Bacilli bacterium]